MELSMPSSPVSIPPLDDNALVVVFGGSGFLGRHIVRRLAKAKYRIRVAVRRPNEALFVKTCGRVGQVEIVAANIRDDASVAAALEGADAVVNTVGILYETGRQKFDAVQAEGAARLAKAASEAGIDRFVQLSAIGADAASESHYARTKAQGEQAVQAQIANAHILRPSIVVGPEDDFFNRFAAMAMLAPALPLIGGGVTRYQPVTVYDVADAVAACLAGAQPGIYELGGPQQFCFRALMEMLLKQICRERLLLPLPFAAASVIAAVARLMPKPLLTPDQLILLKSDNVVNDALLGFDALGLTTMPIEAILPDYLARYRPQGKKPT
jgi:uncharacterized protein YbjT (DUF2867 family)